MMPLVTMASFPVIGIASLEGFTLGSLIIPLLTVFVALAIAQYVSSTFFDPLDKIYGVRTTVAGPGVAYRHRRFLGFLETPFEGATTLPALLELSAKRHRDRPLLGTRRLLKREQEWNEKAGKAFEKLTQGEYVWETYEEVHKRAMDFGAGLVRAGHGKGEMVALFAETRAEWLLALHGAFRQGFVVVTVYASLGEDALVHSLNETKATTVVCDHKQLQKVKDVASRLPSLKRVVVMAEHQSEEEEGKMEQPKEEVKEDSCGTLQQLRFEEVEEKGKVKEEGDEEKEAANLPAPADLAVVMYTSGSTGQPKGVMMSHANLVATIGAVMAMVPDAGPSDSYFAYLPLAHVLELAAENGMIAIGAAIGYGSPLTMIDSAGKVKKGSQGDTTQLEPTLMAAVPAILDRIRDGVRKQIDTKGPTVKKTFDTAYSRVLASIDSPNSIFRFFGQLEARVLWDRLVFKRIRSVVGGRLRFLLSGGAPLSPDTQRFMNICFGIPIGQGYGLTETCAGGTFTEWNDPSVGRVGPPIPCCIIKLIDWEEGNYRITDLPLPRGEICIGGPSVTMGYYNSPDKTDEVYKTDENGVRWFHTGDVGQFHPDGVLEIIDRKKDIVKLQAGEYVSLGKVEAALQTSPLVDSIMVHADPSKAFAVALVVPTPSTLSSWAEAKGLGEVPLPELCKLEDATQEVLRSLGRAGKEAKLEKFELPARIMLLPDPWTPESGLVTAALKLKRENVRAAFAEQLKSLYEK